MSTNKGQITELENHHFATNTEIINSDKKHQWMVKFMHKAGSRTDFIYIVLESLPTK